MNYESKFLDKQGLTLAEANYTANIIKELCEKIANEISRMSLFSSKLIFNGQEKTFNKEYKVDNLETKCMEEGNLYALSAWLREAIKEKNRLLEQTEYDTFGFIFKVLPAVPALLPTPTEEDIKKELSVSELSEFLACEAKAAHLGKKVHPNGVFDKWFKDLKNTPPIQIHPENKDYVIYLTQLVFEEDLYKIYFNLQKEYREAESKVNYYKAKIKNLLSDKIREVNNINSETRKAYQEEVDKLNTENHTIRLEIHNKKLEKAKELSELKIIIPNSLQKTMDFVTEYSRK
jgi:hypothetical protein